MIHERIITVLFSLSIISVFGVRANYSQDDVEREKVIVCTKDKSVYDRAGTYSIEVFLLPLLSELEINCSDEGNVAVYLFNFRNQLCGYTEFDSSVTSFERLDVPKESGTYHIAIITDKSYSEGTFTK